MQAVVIARGAVVLVHMNDAFGGSGGMGSPRDQWEAKENGRNIPKQVLENSSKRSEQTTFQKRHKQFSRSLCCCANQTNSTALIQRKSRRWTAIMRHQE